mgnify:CR=1 FL=1
MKFYKGRIKILPLLVLVGLLSLALRSGTFISDLTAYAAQEDAQNSMTQAKSLSVNAQQDPALNTDGIKDISPGAGEDLPENLKIAQADQDQAQQDNSENAEATPGDATEGEGETPPITEKWRDAGDLDIDTSRMQQEMIEDIQQRRERLQQKEQQLSRREALLKAAEKELERKFKEMAVLRDDIEKLLEEQSKEEKERIESLVKIYSGMKAKDAARIFNTLDINVMVEIMKRMSERKTGPILAEMNSDKARAVTMMLAQEKKLPEIPENLRN